MNPARATELRVGIFVTLALVIGTALVFTLGDRSALFASKVHFVARFHNVAGLRPGSPVRLSGIDVGTVGAITFREDGQLDVELEVRENVAALITGPTTDPATPGTVASLASKGLLGDMLVQLTPGQGAPLAPGSQIPTVESPDMFAAIAGAGDLIEDARPAVENVRQFTESLADEQFRNDLQVIAHNLAELSRMLTEEDGTIPRLIRDPELADQVQGTLGGLRLASNELAQTARNLRSITNEIESGDGTVHDLIYGTEGSRLIAGLADTAGEAATILRDVRTGDGNVHDILYGDEAGDLIGNLTAMSADLRAVMAEIRAGRGTLGGLLMDPSIYEDIKRIVGNLERNEILRALVRYSIREDQPRPQVPTPQAGGPVSTGEPQETIEQPIVMSQPAEDDP